MTKEKIQLKKNVQSPKDPNKSGPAGQAKGIAEAISTAKELLGKEGKIVKAEKTAGGWEIEIEVVEQSEYMKKIGISKPVYDRDIYHVVLDQDLNLLSYERQGQKSNNRTTPTS